MFRIDASDTSSVYCDGVSRRSFVQLGVAGMATAGLADILAARAARGSASVGRTADSVILLWLDGGPGHMDLYDMKPEAPAEYRGFWKPIPTNVSGIEISPLFPKQARIADKFALLRSLHHDNGDHFAAAHGMLTSRIAGVSGAATAGKSPALGSIVAKLRGSNQPAMPAYVGVPYSMSVGLRPGYFGANYLGRPFDPFDTAGDPNAPNFEVQNLGLNGLTLDALDDRKKLLGTLDGLRRDVDRTGAVDAMDRFQRSAYELVSGAAARAAFDLSKEEPRLRDQYGRNTFGQSCLLARRLVQAGTTFVTCHYGGWDHHWDLQKGMDNNLPIVDAAVSSLVADLEARGLLDRTLVLLCGEFSRTPRMNDGGNGGAPMSMGTPGRDHWGNSMFCFLAGGGVRGGTVVGATDKKGEAPVQRAVTPGNLHATIYHALGIDPTTSFLDNTGRPIAATDDVAPIHELFG
ncbi:MAG: DUF1501 domain-containing protein [Planctomycetia bacterium]